MLNCKGPGWFDSGYGGAHGAFGVGDPGTTGNYWRVGDRDEYVLFDNTGTGTVASTLLTVGDSSGSGSPGSNSFSVAMRVYLNSTGVLQGLYGGMPDSVGIRISTLNVVELLKIDTALLGSGSTALSSGVWYDIGLSYDGATVRFYLNGAADGSASSAQTFTHAQQHWLGYNDASPDIYLQNGGRIAHCIISRDVWPVGVFAAISDNPYQVLEPQPVNLYWSSAAPATIVGPLIGGSHLLTNGPLVHGRLAA
jgi:hypothetical protein